MILVVINIETLLDHFSVYRPEQLQILMALSLPFLPSSQRSPKSSLSHPCSLKIPHILRHVSIRILFPDSLLMFCEDVEAVICVNRRSFIVFHQGSTNLRHRITMLLILAGSKSEIELLF
jgi:hypothetical protein